MPVAHEVLTRASTHPSAVALSTPTRTCTGGELAAAAIAGAQVLRSAGVGPGSLVAVDLDDPVDLVAAVLAADLVGALPLVCDASWSDEQRQQVLESLRPVHHVRAALAPTEAAGHAASALTSDAPHPPGPDDLAWAGFSSGSTGAPRAVVRRRASWTASFAEVSRLARLGPGDTVLVIGAPASSLWFFAVAHALAVGATVLHLPRAASPGLREALGRADVVHGVPQAVEDVLAVLEQLTAVEQLAAGGLDARRPDTREGSARTPAPTARVRTLVAGGAAVRAGVRERAAALGADLVTYYGAVELSFVAVDTDGLGLRPFDQVQLDVRPVGAGGLGEVWVRSPWIAKGYLADASGPLRRDADAWVTVGDLAELGDGPLRLRGRGDGAVLTGAATVVPEDVEVVLRTVPGVSEVVVVGTPHPDLGSVVTAVVEGTGITRRALDDAVRRHLSATQRPRRWLRVDTLPRTSSGKPARALVAAGLADGSLTTVEWS